MKGSSKCFLGLSAVIIAVLISMVLLYVRKSAHVEQQLNETERELEYQNKYVGAIWGMRDAALSSDKEQEAKQLFELGEQRFGIYTPVPLQGLAKHLVDAERERAIREIIQDFRTKTGKDLGNKAGPWILEYGDESYKQLERQLEHSSK
jgi:hypothetical protein